MQPQSSGQGFDTSHSRILRDVLIIVSVVAVIIVCIFWLLSRLTGWAIEAVPTRVDTFIGETASSSYVDDSSVCDDPSMNAYVDALTKPVMAEFGEQPYAFTFVVVDEEVPNAFALPGGFVTIHSGLIENADSGEEIAAVLAHEVAHVTHRHGLKRIVRSAGIAIAVGLVFGSTDLAILADYASDLGSLAYDRDQEREADQTAREVLTAARIDPRGMARFFEKLLEEEQDTGGIPSFLSTHPDLKERIEDSLNAPAPSGRMTKLPAPEGLRCRAVTEPPSDADQRHDGDPEPADRPLGIEGNTDAR
ncbi:MAG: M48 family metallopeptidase [Myxococcota bacterium]